MFYFFILKGTTWIQQIVYLIVNSREPVKDHEGTMEERFPYLEYTYPGIKELAKRKSPRYLKTHLPYNILPYDLQEGKGKVRNILCFYCIFIT